MTLGDSGPVRAWAEPVVIPTYPVMPPDRNPMFLEKRVYQGSSGRVYPNRITDRVSDERVDQAWQAVYLENEFIRLMILPDIGGRIHVGQDKTNGYDFFYRQHVIKPALVGLLGPWISGGVEFNWPQHHRPSTFMPVDWAIEEEPDGSRTVWLGEHEPMQRMKGMVGIRLRPGSSVVEARVRLSNRTPYAQSFLWWANVGVHVHDRYQSFFPPDVTYVADHARRAMSTFPVARGHYYGIDYGARPEAEADLSWYANIPVPTSYMVLDTEHDFMGGYDHEARAGLVHVADHRIAPGKKQWTWGSAEFGQAWNRNLTDEDGPYIELMAGVFTDNQPDFSWLAPYETRTFEQHWYPIREIGPATAANTEVAVSLRVDRDVARFGVAATRRINGAQVLLSGSDGVLAEHRIDLAPDAPFTGAVGVPKGVDPAVLRLDVKDAGQRLVIEARLPRRRDPSLPAPATEPPSPEQVESVDELFLIGLHLEQYRHATRSPEPWWREALSRDPDDARTNTALAVRFVRAGDPAAAEPLLRRAIARLTALNPNPADGEPYYQLGLCLQAMGRLGEAEAAFVKASWSRPWQAAAAYRLAQLRGRAGDLAGAIRWTEQALDADARHATAGTLRAALLRRIGRVEEASAALATIIATDPLDQWAREERRRAARPVGPGGDAEDSDPASSSDGPGLPPPDSQAALDIALDYAAAGLNTEALEVLEAAALAPGRSAPSRPAPMVDPMVVYALGWLSDRAGDHVAALEHYRRAATMPPDGCFPARGTEIEILESAQVAVPDDPRAPYYLGNLFYDRRRYADAIACWRRARRLDPAFATVHRNLGIAEANVLGRPTAARRSYLRAFAADPGDGRVLYELDQLLKLQGASPAARLARLEAHRARVDERDDLGVEYATLLEQLDRPDAALAYLLGRRFHPWEGGEGRALGAYVATRLRLARARLDDGDAARAVTHVRAALEPPTSLGEVRHPLDPEHEIRFELGRALRAAGDEAGACEQWQLAAEPPPIEAARTAATYFHALALRAIGRETDAVAVLRGMSRDARRQARRTVGIDYFATSLPTFLLFEDDLDRRNRTACRYLEGLALLGLGNERAARRAFRDVLAVDRNHPGAGGMQHQLSRPA